MAKFSSPWAAESQWWHPVCATDDVHQSPLAVQLLEHPLVLWRDGSAQLHAFADQCPHRGAKFSLGEVVQGQLQCPYHGWRFDGVGRCAHVPAVPDFVAPASHCAVAFEVQERHGLVWVRLQAASSINMPLFAAEDDTALRKVNCGPYTVATSAPRLVENFLDMAHFSYVHRGWLGDADHAQIHRYEVSEVEGVLQAMGCKAWQPQSNRLAAQGAWVDYSFTLNHPYAAVLTKVPDAQSLSLPEYREAIAVFICPVSPTECKVWFRLAVADQVSSEDELRAFQNTIFLQDQPVLESQQPQCLPLWSGAEAHVASDRMSVAYRRWLQAHAIRFGVQADAP